ncbi:MAG: hypothetical protein ABW328_14280, partial [Ilumatobacteraceae bacterium]
MSASVAAADDRLCTASAVGPDCSGLVRNDPATTMPAPATSTSTPVSHAIRPPAEAPNRRRRTWSAVSRNQARTAPARTRGTPPDVPEPRASCVAPAATAASTDRPSDAQRTERRPTELRSVLKRDSRDLVAEFRSMAPARQPISLQRWGPRRVLLALGVVGLGRRGGFVRAGGGAATKGLTPK